MTNDNTPGRSRLAARLPIAIMLCAIIVIQTLVFIYAGSNKAYFHCDENWSYGLTNYDGVQFQWSEGYYDVWHTKDYFIDYLTVGEDEMFDLAPVYVNQMNDVHPPLYYLLLRISQSFTPGQFSFWTGIILNIVILAFVTPIVYIIADELLEKRKYHQPLAALLALFSAITLAGQTNAIYIRMYALSTLNTVIVMYLHLRLAKDFSKKNLILIGVFSVLGSLTHYFFIFWLALLGLVNLIGFIRKKEKDKVKKYLLMFGISAVFSLAIFPFSLKHLFGTDVGGRVSGNLVDLDNFERLATQFKGYIKTFHENVFNHLTLVLIVLIAVSFIICLIKKKKVEVDPRFKQIWIPAVLYFIFVCLGSTLVSLRYLLPVTPLFFIGAFYLLECAVRALVGDKWSAVGIAALALAVAVTPFIKKYEPLETYSERREICERFENGLGRIPALFWYTSNHNIWNENICFYTLIDEMYIAKDGEVTKEYLEPILEGKDLSNGFILLLNVHPCQDGVPEKMADVLGYEHAEKVGEVSVCEIYHIY